MIFLRHTIRVARLSACCLLLPVLVNVLHAQDGTKIPGLMAPGALVYGFADTLPWAEAIIGLLILLGAATRLALISGALLMLVLTFGTSLLQDWNVAGLQLIYAVVYFLLLAFVEHNRWSIDRLVAHN